jgi:hypothetical protein
VLHFRGLSPAFDAVAGHDEPPSCVDAMAMAMTMHQTTEMRPVD